MIGYYAHHHGVGHMTRADVIARESEEPVTVLSSRAAPADHHASAWVTLPLDVDDAPPIDPDVNGLLHWAPIGVDGLTERMAAIASWVVAAKPRLVVVDVSVEIALFVRLLGIPVAVVAMPGDRADPVHSLAYRIADTIVAPWAQAVYDPQWLHPYRSKTVYSGSISRFDGRDRSAANAEPSVVVLGGAGGSALTESDVAACAARYPEYVWRTAGLSETSWIADVWPVLCSASVVVTHAGQNSIADVASASAPAIVIPQQRPFGEQAATAEALGCRGIAAVRDSWPALESWNSLLSEALDTGGRRWTALQTRGAGARAAAALGRSM